MYLDIYGFQCQFISFYIQRYSKIHRKQELLRPAATWAEFPTWLIPSSEVNNTEVELIACWSIGKWPISMGFLWDSTKKNLHFTRQKYGGIRYQNRSWNYPYQEWRQALESSSKPVDCHFYGHFYGIIFWISPKILLVLSREWGNDPQSLSIIIPFPNSHPFHTFSITFSTSKKLGLTTPGIISFGAPRPLERIRSPHQAQQWSDRLGACSTYRQLRKMMDWTDLIHMYVYWDYWVIYYILIYIYIIVYIYI